jgi:hypothetical protein
MTNLRSLVEKDLSQTIEAEFSTPVILVSPTTGERIDKTTDGRRLCGRVLWSHKEIDPATGEPVIVPTPVVTLRTSSLPQVPKSGEVWAVIIPESVQENAPLKNYVTDQSGIVEDAKNFGFINLFLVETENVG